jgi:hypothetical protein
MGDFEPNARRKEFDKGSEAEDRLRPLWQLIIVYGADSFDNKELEQEGHPDSLVHDRVW